MENGGALAEFRASWRVLLAAVVGTAAGLPSLLYYTTGIFMDVLTRTFAWSRTEVSLGVLVTTFGLLFAAPVVGRLCDRNGARIVASVSLGFLSLGFLALAMMPGSFAVYLTIIAVMTFLASGSSSISFTRAVNTCFDKGRGLALGLTLTGIGFGAVVAPPVLARVMADFGWRAGYVLLAAIAAAAVPFVYRNLHERRSIAATAIDSHGQSLAEAIRESHFWILACAFLLIAIGVSGLVVHFIPMLTDAGLSLQRATAVFALLGSSIVCGRLVIGVLMDRFFGARVGALAFSATAFGCILMAIEGSSVAALTAVTIGLAIGAEMDLIAYFAARYFGMRNYGQINGILYSLFVFGAGVSPVLTGYSYEATGNYQISLVAAGAMSAIAALLFLTLPRFPDSPTVSKDSADRGRATALDRPS